MGRPAFVAFVLGAALLLGGCAGASATRQPAGGGGGGGSSAEAERLGGPPAWFAGERAITQDARYLTATGAGDTAQDAQDQALANLVRIFAAEVGAVRTLNDDAVETDAALDRTTRVRNNVRVTARETLEGTQTLRLALDAEGRYYALVGLSRAEAAARLHGDLEAERLRLSAALREAEAAAAPVERLGHARRAVQHAAASRDLRRQLVVVEGGVRDPDAARDLRQEQAALAAFRDARDACPVALRADPGVPRRVTSGVAEALGEAGFAVIASPGDASEAAAAALRADLRFDAEPTLFSRRDNTHFVAWTLTLDLTDLARGRALGPYVLDGRSGALGGSRDATRRAHLDAQAGVRRALPAFIWDAVLPATAADAAPR